MSNALVQRLLILAAERVGGASALVQHLRLPYSELNLYLTGEAMPPAEVLSRTAELLREDLKAIKSEFPEEAWRSLFPSGQAVKGL